MGTCPKYMQEMFGVDAGWEDKPRRRVTKGGGNHMRKSMALSRELLALRKDFPKKVKYRIVVDIECNSTDDPGYVFDELDSEVFRSVHDGGKMDGTWKANIRSINKVRR